jgi:hypothetical protein
MVGTGVIGVTVGTGVTGVLVTIGVVGTGVTAPDVPTKDITLCAGSEKVKLFPDTVTAVCFTRLLLEFVSHGVTDDAESPLRLNCWLVADEFEFMTTIANLPVDGSWYAEHSSPDVGAAVAPMRT